MNCTTIRNCIAEYAVGLLSGQAKTEVESHLAECPSCRAEFEKQERVIAMVALVEPIEPPVDIWNEVYKRISSTPVHPTIWEQLWKGRYRRASRWSLGFVTAALTALILYTHTVPPPVTKVSAQEYVGGHAIYASQDLLADQTALYSQAVMAERFHVLKGQTL